MHPSQHKEAHFLLPVTCLFGRCIILSARLRIQAFLKQRILPSIIFCDINNLINIYLLIDKML